MAFFLLLLGCLTLHAREMQTLTLSDAPTVATSKFNGYSVWVTVTANVAIPTAGGAGCGVFTGACATAPTSSQVADGQNTADCTFHSNELEVGTGANSVSLFFTGLPNCTAAKMYCATSADRTTFGAVSAAKALAATADWQNAANWPVGTCKTVASLGINALCADSVKYQAWTVGGGLTGLYTPDVPSMANVGAVNTVLNQINSNKNLFSGECFALATRQLCMLTIPACIGGDLVRPCRSSCIASVKGCSAALSNLLWGPIGNVVRPLMQCNERVGALSDGYQFPVYSDGVCVADMAGNIVADNSTATSDPASVGGSSTPAATCACGNTPPCSITTKEETALRIRAPTIFGGVTGLNAVSGILKSLIAEAIGAESSDINQIVVSEAADNKINVTAFATITVAQKAKAMNILDKLKSDARTSPFIKGDVTLEVLQTSTAQATPTPAPTTSPTSSAVRVGGYVRIPVALFAFFFMCCWTWGR